MLTTSRAKTISRSPVGSEVIELCFFESELGHMTTAWRGDCLAAFTFGQWNVSEAYSTIRQYLSGSLEVVEKLSPHQQQVVSLLQAYATGQPIDFTSLKLDLDYLTPWGREVMDTCRHIPRGSTLSYAELAKQCGRPGAARAVGNLMANNRHPLIIPCHRVLASGGGLGGYSAPQGLEMKRLLLQIEGAIT